MLQRDCDLVGFCQIAFISFLVTVLPKSSFAIEHLTLDGCLQQINDHSIQVSQAMVNELKAKGALVEADRPRLPQVVLQGNLAESSDTLLLSPDANKAVVRVEQGTLPFGSAWRLGEQKQAELEVAQLSVIETKADVRLLVKQLYFAILRDQDSIEKLNSIEIELKNILSAVLPRFQIGRAPSFDLVKVKTSIADLTRTRELTQAQLAGEKTELAQIVGVQNTTFVLQDVSKDIPELPEVNPYSIESNPTLRGLDRGIGAADLAVSTTRASRLPSLSAAVEYGGTGLTPDTMALTWNAFAQVRLTVFDWGLISSQVSQAEQASLLARQKMEAEKQKEVADLEQTKELARAHLADQQRMRSLLPELKRAESSAIDRYKRAGLGILELSDSVSLLLQNLLNERSAFYAYLSDIAKINRLTGSDGAGT